MDKKEAALEIMAIVRDELASARNAVEGQPSWRTIDAAMSKLRRIASDPGPWGQRASESCQSHLNVAYA